MSFPFPKDEVKRSERPPARSLGPKGPLTSSLLIQVYVAAGTQRSWSFTIYALYCQGPKLYEAELAPKIMETPFRVFKDDIHVLLTLR